MKKKPRAERVRSWESITAPTDPVAARLLALVERQATTIETLTTQLVELKRAGFAGKPVEPKQRKVKAPEKSDEAIVRERDSAAIARMTKDFVKQGATPAAAMKEAQRIRQESTRTTVHPSND